VEWRTTTDAILTIHAQETARWKRMLQQRWRSDDPVARFYWTMRANHNPWIVDQDANEIDQAQWGTQSLQTWMQVTQHGTTEFRIKWRGRPCSSKGAWADRDTFIRQVTVNARGWRPHESYPDNTALRLLGGERSGSTWTRDSSGGITNGKALIRPTSINQSVAHLVKGSGEQHGYVHFALHPWIARGYGPEPTTYTYSYRKLHHQRFQKKWKRWKREIQGKSEGERRVLQRLESWDKRDNDVSKALQRTSWAKLWNGELTTAAEKLATYYWKLGAMNVHTSAGIPTCNNCSQAETLMHTMWDCRQAQETWSLLAKAWGATGRDMHKYKISILADHPPLASSTLRRHHQH